MTTITVDLEWDTELEPGRRKQDSSKPVRYWRWRHSTGTVGAWTDDRSKALQDGASAAVERVRDGHADGWRMGVDRAAGEREEGAA